MYCTNEQGSALYDATLGDKELIDQLFEEMKAEQSAKKKVEKPEEEEWRPPRRGYTRGVEAVYDLTDNIVALRAEMGRWPSTQTERAFSKRPWFPAEVAKDRMRRRAKANVNRAIATAQQHWGQHHDEPGVRS